MNHSFNTDVAKIVGVNGAILFENINHWCEKNRANNHHFYDGEYWTYNSIKAFEELFPYLSSKQIKSALEKLKEFGFIGFGEFNQNPYDRTRWYCDLTQKQGLNLFLTNVLKCKMENSKMSNVEDAKKVSSITDINTDIKQSTKVDICASKNNDLLFDDLPTKKLKEKKEEKPTKEIFTSFHFRKKLIELGVEEMYVDDFMKIRKDKKASNTQSSLNALLNECDKNNFSIKEAIKICAERGWKGFKYSWIKESIEEQKSKNKIQDENRIYM